MHRRLALALIAGGLLAASASPASDAVAKAAGYSERQQDAQIHHLRGSVQGIGKAIAAFTKINHAQDLAIDDVKSSVAAITGGVPDVIKGLQQLKDGLVTLGSAYKAVEYGAVGLYGGTNNQLVGVRVNSPDIPDDGNQAKVDGIVVSGNPSAGSAVPLTLRAAIRSAESDGQSATGDPAGQAGGSLIAVCAPAAASGGCGAASAGQIVAGCQTPSSTFSLPDGTTTSQSLVTIQKAVPRTDVNAPSNSGPEVGGTGTDLRLTSSSGGACTLPALGAPYQVIITVQAVFADIPTSLSPGPTD